MTEYDAFGNPIEPREATASVTATPASVAPPASTPTPSPTPSPLATPLLTALPDYGPSKRSWGGRAIGLSILLSFLVPLAVGGYFAVNAFHTAKDAVDTVVTTARGFAPATSAPSGSATARGSSMLHASTLRKALATAQRDPGGRLTLLRVEAARADLQLARKGGGLTLVQLRADGGRSVVETPGTPSRTIGFARVDAHAPSRLVRQAAHRLGRSTKSIDYVVLMNVLGGPRWSAFFKGGAAFQGDAHGRIVRRIQ